MQLWALAAVPRLTAFYPLWDDKMIISFIAEY